MKKIILLFIPLALFLSAYTDAPTRQHAIVQGTIIAQETGKPVSNAHVYIIHGEEEALTDNKGFFKIETWEKLPVRVTVESRDYWPVSVVISDIAKRKTIRLKQR